MELSLPETRRLRPHAEAQDLDPQLPAAEAALAEDTIGALLRGGSLPPGTGEQRVCERVKTQADAHVLRTQQRPGDLVTEVVGCRGISEEWARKLLKGKEIPNVPLLRDLVEFFEVEGEEAFFTVPPALNHVLLSTPAMCQAPG